MQLKMEQQCNKTLKKSGRKVTKGTKTVVEIRQNRGRKPTKAIY